MMDDGDSKEIVIGAERFSMNSTTLTIFGETGANLPANIWEMSQLKELTVEASNITSIPPPLPGQALLSLETLVLGGSGIKDILPSVWQAMPNLRKLESYENELSAVTMGGIGQHLSNLEHLLINLGEISEIPRSFGNLRNLKFFKMGSNRLESVPMELGNMTLLKYLYLGDNQIKDLPESIGNLTNLTKLYLSDNQIQRLPQSIGGLTNLKGLDLDSNLIQRLPQSIGNLTNLKVLELSHNQIQRLPQSIGNLRRLRTLRLNYNPIERLPRSINDLSELESLYINNTNIERLPASLLDNDRLAISITNTPMERSMPQGGNYALTTTVSYTDTSDSGSTRRRRRRLGHREAFTTSPPSLLDIVSAYLLREHLTLE